MMCLGIDFSLCVCDFIIFFSVPRVIVYALHPVLHAIHRFLEVHPNLSLLSFLDQ